MTTPSENIIYSSLIMAHANNITAELYKDMSGTGLWEMCIQSVTMQRTEEGGRGPAVTRAYRLGCGLVRESGIIKGQMVNRPVTQQVFVTKPEWTIHLHQGNTSLWYEVNNPSKHIVFELRDHLTDTPIRYNDDLVIHMLYRRKA